MLAVGHAARDQRWHDRWREDRDDSENLYAKHKREGLGKAPSQASLDALRYAAEHSGMSRGADE